MANTIAYRASRRDATDSSLVTRSTSNKGFQGGDRNNKLPVSGKVQWVAFLVLVIVLQLCFGSLVMVSNHNTNTHQNKEDDYDTANNNVDDANISASKKKCAINFFGLPRAYSSLVLPSIVQNVIVPNAHYGCDYFVHFYALEHEVGGRSGLGGALHPDQIYLLEREVQKQYAQQNAHDKPVVQFVVEREEDFWKKYAFLLDKINQTKDDQTNKLLYFPFKAQTYTKQTMANIIKMWHSIQQAWKLMERYGQEKNIAYEQVAMLRSDVVYMTPMDLYEHDNKIVVPGFGRYPVNDRSVMGPAKGVQVWATGRFSRIEEHVQFMKKNHFGWGLHEERFLSYTLFPAIEKAMLQMATTADDTSAEKDANHDSSSQDTIIMEHPTMCFMRARADETVWTSDCKVNAQKSIVENLLDGEKKSYRQVVEQVIGRTCPGEAPVQIKANAWALDCHGTDD